MKTLILIRHAKSSWDDPDLDDFDRPLNARGMRDAPKMGKRLKEKGLAPDRVMSSPANRALTTAGLFAQAMQLPSGLIKKEKKLYHASADEMLALVRALPDEEDCIFLVGHNPGLTDFANELQTEEEINNIPTAGIVAIKFDLQHWKSVKAETGELAFYHFPKEDR